jgi:hypothetical protein
MTALGPTQNGTASEHGPPLSGQVPLWKKIAVALGFARGDLLEVASAGAVYLPANIPTDEPPPVSADDSEKQILALLELELGVLSRRLERVARSVANGAQSAGTRLSTIAIEPKC